MADFKVSFIDYLDGSGTYTFRTYFMMSKENAIRLAKQDADRLRATEFSIEYKSSGKSVGNWVKKGSRWYKEW